MAHKVLFISHDASRTGAPIVFLHLLRWLRENTTIGIGILLKRGGELENEFNDIAPYYRWDTKSRSNLSHTIFRKVNKKLKSKEKYHKAFIESIKENQFDLLYVNSVASCEVIKPLKVTLNIPVILHVHELEIAILEFCDKNEFEKSIPYVDIFIAVSNAVKNNLVNNYNIPESKIVIINETVPVSDYQKKLAINNEKISWIDFGIPISNPFIVFASGTTDWRKGADLFSIVANKCIDKANDIYFIWLGGENEGLGFEKLLYDVKKMGLDGRVHFAGKKKDIVQYLRNGHLFLLPSREDPFPLVCLEAASVGLPIICFGGVGGMPEFVEDDAGIVVPYLDLEAMSNAVIRLYREDDLRKKLSHRASKKIVDYDINIIGRKIESLIYNLLNAE